MLMRAVIRHYAESEWLARWRLEQEPRWLNFVSSPTGGEAMLSRNQPNSSWICGRTRLPMNTLRPKSIRSIHQVWQSILLPPIDHDWQSPCTAAFWFPVDDGRVEVGVWIRGEMPVLRSVCDVSAYANGSGSFLHAGAEALQLCLGQFVAQLKSYFISWRCGSDLSRIGRGPAWCVSRSSRFVHELKYPIRHVPGGQRTVDRLIHAADIEVSLQFSELRDFPLQLVQHACWVLQLEGLMTGLDQVDRYFPHGHLIPEFRGLAIGRQ